uniref:Uncharacterized protein n=1 Tax=viral metagenome TaxID=1070528 RepID=A0A6C0BZE9_9ZZZZ
MWDKADSLQDHEWHKCISALAVDDFPPNVKEAAKHAIVAARRFNEIYIGGDDTECMLQILAASEDHGESPDTDILGSVLLPFEEVKIAYTTRGSLVYAMVCSFWLWSSSSPALLLSDGIYHRLTCKVEGREWTAGSLCPMHLKTLQQSQDAALQDPDATLAIYVPGISSPPLCKSLEVSRAAIYRGAEQDEVSSDNELPARTKSIADFREVSGL